MRGFRPGGRVALFLTFLMSGCGCGEVQPPPPAKNVLIVLWDAARARNLPFYGYERNTTPFLVQLAESSAVFTQARSQTSYTLPSVVTILTSIFPEIHGSYWRREEGKNSFVCHTPGAGSGLYLQELLSAHGMWTGAVVGNPMLRNARGLSESFDAYRAYGGWENTRTVTKTAIDEIRRRGGSPWFLYLHYIDPHSPFDPPEPYRSQFFSAGEGGEPNPGDIAEFNKGNKVWSEADVAGHRDLYDAELRFLDTELEKLTVALAADGVLDETLLIVTADHGEAIGEHEDWLHGSVYEECIHVPLIVRFPQGRLAGRYDFLVESMDIGPTVLRALGIEVPASMAGRSLQEQVAGDWRRAVSYSRYYSKAAYVFPNGKKLICYDEGCRDGAEVFDLRSDPTESRNIAVRNPSLAERLRTEAFGWKEHNVVPGTEISVAMGVTGEDDENALRALGYLR